MTVGGSHAGAEIMLLAITSGARIVEVPVNYLPRVGRLVGHRQPPGRDPRRAADAAADPGDPAPQPAPAGAAAGLHRGAPARPATRRMSSSHFDAIAGRLRRVAARPRRRALPAQAGALRGRALPAGAGARRRLRDRRAGGAPRAGRLRDDGRRPVRGDARDPARAHARTSWRCEGSGTALPFDDDALRPRAERGDAAPHRRPGRRAPDARRDGPRRAPGRPDPRLGPQPAQPVLGAPDGARAAGHRARSG